nr:response regulator [uncultured Carboxylicivirga sp.]
MAVSNSINFLLVEDNPTDAEMTIRSFKKHNLVNEIFHVTNGEDALDFVYSRGKYTNINTSNLKLILLDLKLPKIGGLEILKIIKNDPDKKDLPIVVLTSSAEEKDVIESYRLNVNSYIVKPVDFEHFVTAIRDIGYYWLFLNKSIQ